MFTFGFHSFGHSAKPVEIEIGTAWPSGNAGRNILDFEPGGNQQCLITLLVKLVFEECNTIFNIEGTWTKVVMAFMSA